MAADAAPKQAQAPRYQLTEKCYINDRLYDPESMPFDPESPDPENPLRKPLVITYTGIPSHYMVPVNDSAKAMMEKHKPRRVDPIGALTTIGGAPGDVKA